MRTATALVGAALIAVSTAVPAHAEPECYGYMQFDDTYACVVRVDPPDAELQTVAQVPVDRVCAGSLGCTPATTVPVLYPVVTDAGTVVLFHDGVCYYAAVGDTHTVTASAPDDCP